MSFHSPMKWWRSPLPPSLLTKRSNRFALSIGAGVVFAGVTAGTLGAINNGMGYAKKCELRFELREQTCLARKRIADKFGLPSPLIAQVFNKKYPSSISVYYPLRDASDNLAYSTAASLILAGGSVSLWDLMPRNAPTPRQFFWFRGPAVILGTCAVTTLAIIPLSLYPTYAQLDAHWKAKAIHRAL